jgi:hypothetical protein
MEPTCGSGGDRYLTFQAPIKAAEGAKVSTAEA